MVAFYTAVHLVERLRALDGGHSESHQQRLDFVVANHRTIHDPYKQLLNAAWIARYASNSDFFKKFSNADVKDILIDRYLVSIEEYVDRYVTDHFPPKRAT